MVRVGVGACSASVTGRRGPRLPGSEHTVGAHYLLFPHKDVDLEEEQLSWVAALQEEGRGMLAAPRGDPASLLQPRQRGCSYSIPARGRLLGRIRCWSSP